MEEVVKPKKKRGCLYAALIGLAVVVVLTIALIIIVNNMIQIFGLSTKKFNEYMSLLKEEVSESAIAPHKINSGDYLDFKTKAQVAGFGVFDDNGNVDVNKTTITLDSKLELTNSELAAMINNAFVTGNNSDYEFISLLQLDIIEAKNTTLKSVVKLNLTELKKSIGSFGASLPDKVYLTCESVVTTSGSRLILTNSTLNLNQLSEEKNEEIVALLKKMTSATETDFNFENINNELISNIVSSIARASNANIIISNQKISLEKIA